MQDIPVKLRESSEAFELVDKSHSVKALGVRWYPLSDVFVFESSLQIQNEWTKRKFSSEILKVYDPLGLIAPVIVTVKKSMQELWRQKIHWDQKIPEELILVINSWVQELEMLSEIHFPRKVLPYTLHIFCDASERAYAAAAYVVTEISTNFLAAQSKVPPMKQVTLPKLELMALHLGSRLVTAILYSLRDIQNQPKQIVMYSDSTIVLSWMAGDPSRWTKFVAKCVNRVTQIKETIPKAQFTHVSSKENPADLPSRGCYASELRGHSQKMFKNQRNYSQNFC